VNHLSQMLLFLKAFKRLLNDLLGDFRDDKNILLPVTNDLAADLKVIANAAGHGQRQAPHPGGAHAATIQCLVLCVRRPPAA
jgi:hypothetical protein